MIGQICDLPAHELVRQLKRGEFSAEEALESTLNRIEQVEGRSGSLENTSPDPLDPDRVHAYITVTRERARQQARAVDRALVSGEDPGPLAGVPVAIKDIFCVAATPSTAGSRILAKFVAPYTATPAARVRSDASAVARRGRINKVNHSPPGPDDHALPRRPRPDACLSAIYKESPGAPICAARRATSWVDVVTASAVTRPPKAAGSIRSASPMYR